MSEPSEFQAHFNLLFDFVVIFPKRLSLDSIHLHTLDLERTIVDRHTDAQEDYRDEQRPSPQP